MLIGLEEVSDKIILAGGQVVFKISTINEEEETFWKCCRLQKFRLGNKVTKSRSVSGGKAPLKRKRLYMNASF